MLERSRPTPALASPAGRSPSGQTATGGRSDPCETTRLACPHLPSRVLREDRRDPRSARFRPDSRDLRANARLWRTRIPRSAGAPSAPDGEQAGGLRGRIGHGTTHYIVGYGFSWAVARSLMLAVRAARRCWVAPPSSIGYLRAAFGPTERVKRRGVPGLRQGEQRRRLRAVPRPSRSSALLERRQPGRGAPPSVGQALASRNEQERRREPDGRGPAHDEDPGTATAGLAAIPTRG